MSDFVMLDLSASASAPISMPESLTVREAEKVHARLAQAVRDRQTIVLDCRAATEIDLSFIQLVLSARKSALAAGKSLSVIPPTGSLLSDALRRTGLLGAPEAAPSADQQFWFHREATGGENDPHGR